MTTATHALPAALLLGCDGTATVIELPSSGRDRRTVMYAVLCCASVAAVPLTVRWAMWIADDASLRHEPNPSATALAGRFGRSAPILGPVLLPGAPTAPVRPFPWSTGRSSPSYVPCATWTRSSPRDQSRPASGVAVSARALPPAWGP